MSRFIPRSGLSGLRNGAPGAVQVNMCPRATMRLTTSGLPYQFEVCVSNQLAGETVFQGGKDLDLAAEARSDLPVPAAVPTPRWACRPIPSGEE